jgi:hypothetical protein
MDPTLYGTRGCRRLVTEAGTGDKPGPPKTGGNGSVEAISLHPTSSKSLCQQTPARLDGTAPAWGGQPAAAHRPTQARQLPAGVPATGERPGRQTGLSSSRGVRLVPRRLAPHAVGGEGVYPFKRCGITPFEFQRDHPAHERVAPSSGMGGAPPVSLGPARRNRVRPR